MKIVIMFYVFLFLTFIKVFCTFLLKVLPQNKQKYLGFVYGLMYAYMLILLWYSLAFRFDFSYYQYLTPFNVIVLSLTLSVGYTEYNMSTKHKRIYIMYGIYLAFLLFILHGVVCNFLEEWFGWDLNFLYFPWKH